jgi:hypothetical protein
MKLWEVLRMKGKKWYAAGLGFVLFLCISAESLVNLIL